MIPEEARGQPLEIWFQDEARIGQKGTLAYVWARRGTRPRAVQDTRYASAYLFGAVCPQRGVGAGLVMPRADTEGLNAHLAELARTVAPGAHAVLVLDGAGWHKSTDLVVPSNISLLMLPPYAPELNPEEYCHGNVKRRMKNAVLLSKAEIRNSLDRGFARLRKRPDILLGCFQHAGLKLNQLW